MAPCPLRARFVDGGGPRWKDETRGRRGTRNFFPRADPELLIAELIAVTPDPACFKAFHGDGPAADGAMVIRAD